MGGTIARSALRLLTLGKRLRAYLRYRWWRLVRPKRILFREAVTIPIAESAFLESVRRPLYKREYERCEIDAAMALVEPGDRVLELGAGCGVVTAFVARRLAGTGRVLAYEANADLVASIEAVLRANRLDCEIRNAAIGERDSHADFYPASSFLASSLFTSDASHPARTVPVHAFARVVGEFAPTVILMDVEGSEVELLGSRLPPAVRCISIEFHPGITGSRAVSDAIADLLRQGFDIRFDLLAAQSPVLTFERSA